MFYSQDKFFKSLVGSVYLSSLSPIFVPHISQEISILRPIYDVCGTSMVDRNSQGRYKEEAWNLRATRINPLLDLLRYLVYSRWTFIKKCTCMIAEKTSIID